MQHCPGPRVLTGLHYTLLPAGVKAAPIGTAGGQQQQGKPGDPSSRLRHRLSGSYSVRVGAIAGPTISVSHPSLATRAADFDTDYHESSGSTL